MKGFKFVGILALEFKKMKSNEKELHNTFIRTQKQKKLLMKVTFMMNLNQSVVLLYKTYTNF